MNIAVNCHGITLTEQEGTHLNRRIHFALGRFASRIVKVTVKLRDINGPRGGIDKRCRLAARVEGVGEVVIEDEDAHLRLLVDRTAERMGQLIGRRLERQQFAHDRVAFSGTGPQSTAGASSISRRRRMPLSGRRIP